MSSIFDLSGQSGKKKEKKTSIVPAATKSPISDDEVERTLAKIREMSKDLDQKILETKQKSGIEEQEIRDYIDSLKKDSPKNWAIIKEKKEALQREIMGISEAEQAAKELSTEGKKMKGKTLGGRKRWIDMR